MNHEQLSFDALSAEKLLFDALSLKHHYQHFFYFTDEGYLKTTNEEWPALKYFEKSDILGVPAFELLLTLIDLVRINKNIQLKRGVVYNNSRKITESNAKALDMLLRYLYDKNYVTLYKEGRQQFIVVNPLACKFFS